MEVSSVSEHGEEVTTQKKVMHVVDNPCHLLVQAIRAIVKCFGVHESGNQRNQQQISTHSLPEDKQRNQTSPENETPVVEDRLIFMRRVPAPPISKGGGGQIN